MEKDADIMAENSFPLDGDNEKNFNNCHKFDKIPFPLEKFYPLQKKEFFEKIENCAGCPFFSWVSGCDSCADGRDGRDGITPHIGENYNWWFEDYDTGVPARGTPGRDGIDGLPGRDGNDGADGAPGQDGIDGLPGRDGNDGADGAPGRDGIDGLPGRDGNDGADGAPGQDGIDGLHGEDGIDGLTPSIGANGNWFAGDTDLGIPARGPQGIQGEQGQAGTVGQILGSYDTEEELIEEHPDGNPGDAYYINPDLYVWSEKDKKWINVGPIAGPQGVAGPQGPPGEQGPIGPIGPVGPEGPMGPEGPEGPTGPQGPEGPEPDLTEIYERLEYLEESITQIKQDIYDLKTFVYESEYTEIFATDSRLRNWGVGVVRTGITHSFFGIGKLAPPAHSLGSGTYTLITADQYPPLKLYVGDTTYTQMWIDDPTPTTALITLPVKIDQTGIYFTVPSTFSNLQPNTLLRFTVALVLLPETQTI